MKTSKAPARSKSAKPVAKKIAAPKPKTVTPPAPLDLVQFMQEHGVDVTWHKIVSQSPNSPDQISVTVSHGVYDVSPTGNTITKPTLAEALAELKEQISQAVPAAGPSSAPSASSPTS